MHRLASLFRFIRFFYMSTKKASAYALAYGVGKLPTSRRYNRLPLLRSSPGGFIRSWPYRTYPYIFQIFGKGKKKKQQHKQYTRFFSPVHDNVYKEALHIGKTTRKGFTLCRVSELFITFAPAKQPTGLSPLP